MRVWDPRTGPADRQTRSPSAQLVAIGTAMVGIKVARVTGSVAGSVTRVEPPTFPLIGMLTVAEPDTTTDPVVTGARIPVEMIPVSGIVVDDPAASVVAMTGIVVGSPAASVVATAERVTGNPAASVVVMDGTMSETAMVVGKPAASVVVSARMLDPSELVVATRGIEVIDPSARVDDMKATLVGTPFASVVATVAMSAEETAGSRLEVAAIASGTTEVELGTNEVTKPEREESKEEPKDCQNISR